MYLVSLYFDKSAEEKIKTYIKMVAKASGNTYMIDEHVPPHLTVASFDCRDVSPVIDALNNQMKTQEHGNVLWASVGAFLPHVLYLAIVQNEFLQTLVKKTHETLREFEDVKFSPYYLPYQWLPHTTVGKKLSEKEMGQGFEALQKSFGLFEGEVVKIGLARTKPYEDIMVWDI